MAIIKTMVVSEIASRRAFFESLQHVSKSNDVTSSRPSVTSSVTQRQQAVSIKTPTRQHDAAFLQTLSAADDNDDMQRLKEAEAESRVLFDNVKDTILLPVRFLKSPSTIRFSITTILLSSAALVLLGISVFASVAFYYQYIPAVGFSRTVHLQFDTATIASLEPYAPGYPFGTAPLDGRSIANRQPYDVAVTLHLPRTHTNKAVGNFMLNLTLLGPAAVDGNGGSNGGVVLAQARRPAILKYRSEVVEMAWRIIRLPSLLIGLRHETETLKVKMMDGVEFASGWRAKPAMLKLEVQSKDQMQIYNVRVDFIAKFQGLRWLMYNYRLTSFLIFTGLFFNVGSISMLFIWLICSSIFTGRPRDPQPISTPGFITRRPGSPPQSPNLRTTHLPTSRSQSPTNTKIKAEHDNDADLTENLSDTSRSFPTYSNQPPLRFSTGASVGTLRHVKPEVEEQLEREEKEDTKWQQVEGDDEGDGGREEWKGDSGIGTSLESSAAVGSAVQRRRGVSGKKEKHHA